MSLDSTRLGHSSPNPTHRHPTSHRPTLPPVTPSRAPALLFTTMSLSRFPRLRHIPRPSRSFSTSAPSSAGLSPLARPVANEISAKWKGTSMTGGTTKNFIGGQFVESKADKWLDAIDPVRIFPLLHRSIGAYLPHNSRPRPCYPGSLKRPAKSSNRPSTLLLMPSSPGVGLAFSPVNDLSSSKFKNRYTKPDP